MKCWPSSHRSSNNPDGDWWNTMQKNPNRKIDDTSETPRKQKTRRNRRETECRDKIRSHNHCGICGSNDLTAEILFFCPTCGAEQLELKVEEYSWFWSKEEPNLCQCDKKRYFLKYHHIVILHCNTCRAHKGALCRNCGRMLWSRFDPLKPLFHCLLCGFINF